jgi:Cu/Ag efflux protein CusF
LALISFLWFGVFAAAEGGGYAAHGTVKSVDAVAGTVTIDHEDIPGLMMGMTMKFEVSDPKMLVGVVPGRVVDFRVRKDGERYLVTEIRLVAEHPDGHEGTGPINGRMAPAGG